MYEPLLWPSLPPIMTLTFRFALKAHFIRPPQCPGSFSVLSWVPILGSVLFSVLLQEKRLLLPPTKIGTLNPHLRNGFSVMFLWNEGKPGRQLLTTLPGQLVGLGNVKSTVMGPLLSPLTTVRKFLITAVRYPLKPLVPDGNATGLMTNPPVRTVLNIKPALFVLSATIIWPLHSHTAPRPPAGPGPDVARVEG